MGFKILTAKKETIFNRSRMIEQSEQFTPQNQRLIFGGTVLSNDAQQLKDVRSLRDNSVILIQLIPAKVIT